MNTFISVIGCLFVIAGIAIPTALKINASRWGEESQTAKKKIWTVLLALGCVFIILGNAFVIIPTGYTGVRSTFGQVSEEVAPKGFNAKIPFVENIKLVNNKQQDIEIESQIWGESSEKVPVYCADLTVSFQISETQSAWLYANVANVNKLIDEKIVASAVKAALVEQSVETVTNRSYIEPAVSKKLQSALDEKYGEATIIVKKVVINDMDFEPSYNQAIAEKSIAEQNRQRQEIENQTAIARAEADKKVAIANAEGAAESKRITAEADAEANRILEESLTDKVIQNKLIEKWDGKLPIVSGDSNSIIDIGALLNK